MFNDEPVTNFIRFKRINDQINKRDPLLICELNMGYGYQNSYNIVTEK